MITENKSMIFEIIMPGLLKNSKSHWNQSIQSMTVNAMKSLTEIDKELFDKLSAKIKKEEEESIKKEKEAMSQWEMLAKEFN